jgi:hypothetical protein
VSWIDRMFAPRWAGTWTLVRWLYVAVALVTHLPRVLDIRDAYASDDLVIASGLLPLATWIVITPPTAYALWALGVIGLVLVAVGGRTAKPGLVLWVVAMWLLLSAEAMNIKAYDRLLAWQALPMLFAPIGERNLTAKWRSPFAYWMLFLLYATMYTMTGWAKLLLEPHWRDGSVLAYTLVEVNFGGKPLGVWLSGHMGLCRAIGFATMIFECGFPICVLIRKTNPWWLLAGIGFHLGILLTLHAGTLSLVVLAAYPALLDAELARRWWERVAAPVPVTRDLIPA